MVSLFYNLSNTLSFPFQIVQKKLTQKWQQDCPKLREVESRCKEREVISSWSRQIQHKQQVMTYFTISYCTLYNTHCMLPVLVQSQ